MSFKVAEYILPTLGILVITWLLVGGVCAYYIIAKVKAPSDKSIVLFIPAIFFLLQLLATVYSLSAVSHWGPLLNANLRATAIGSVEKIESGTIPLYWDKQNGGLTSPSYVTIDGIEYYILTNAGLSVGDRIAFLYCPDGNAVLQWKNASEGILPSNTPKEPSSGFAQHPAADAESFAFFTAERFIAFCGVILVAFFVFQKALIRKRLAYINNHSVAVEGLVCPHNISVATCAFEFLLSAFAVLSLPTRSAALIIFLFIIAGCMWILRFFIQKTMILYENNTFTYVSAWFAKTYHISSVTHVAFLPTKQTGFLQLQIGLNNGNSIKLEQLNFSGLEQFYDWLVNTTANHTS